MLGMVVAEHVYLGYPDRDEGWLTRARASVVRASALAEMARELDVGGMVRLGKGEESSGGRAKSSILADTLEAVIGAVYLDGGWEAAERLVLRLLAERIAALTAGTSDRDDKSRFHELVARHFTDGPQYHIDEAGPEHNKHFRAVATVEGRPLGEGEGRSKKQAEQAAARAAWHRLVSELEPATTAGASRNA